MKIREQFELPATAWTTNEYVDQQATIARLDNLASDLECELVLKRPNTLVIISEYEADMLQDSHALYEQECFENVL